MDSVTRDFIDNNSSKNSVINCFSPIFYYYFSFILTLFIRYTWSVMLDFIVCEFFSNELWGRAYYLAWSKVWTRLKTTYLPLRGSTAIDVSQIVLYTPFSLTRLGSTNGIVPDTFLWGDTSITSRTCLPDDLTIMRFETWPKSEISNHSATRP